VVSIATTGGEGCRDPDPEERDRDGNPDTNPTLGRREARRGHPKAKRRQAKRREHEIVGAAHHRLSVRHGTHQCPDDRPQRPHDRDPGGSHGGAQR
jgi:hypothetical protein